MSLKSNGAAIRERRLLAGLTIREFADAVGYHPNYVSQIELGHDNGGPNFHRKTAELLDCEINDITDGIKPRRTPVKTSAATSESTP